MARRTASACRSHLKIRSGRGRVNRIGQFFDKRTVIHLLTIPTSLLISVTSSDIEPIPPQFSWNKLDEVFTSSTSLTSQWGFDRSDNDSSRSVGCKRFGLELLNQSYLSYRASSKSFRLSKLLLRKSKARKRNVGNTKSGSDE